MKEKILSVLKELSNEYPNIRFGLAGSYVNESYTSKSDVDIVLDAPESVMGSLDVNVNLYNTLSSKLGKEIDLVWLKLLKESSDESDNLARSMGIGINMYTPYRTIMNNVIWVDINEVTVVN